MADGIERELRALDGDRPLPPALYARLEAALLEDAEGRPGRADDVAAAFEALDAPRPVPASTRAALEQALITVPSSHRRGRLFLGIAAAALVVVGSVAALRGGTSTTRSPEVAAGTRSSVPEAGVPPVLQAPTTLPARSFEATAGAKPVAPPTTRRRTTTTTWNCGLCAQNGYADSTAAAAAAEPAPPGAPQVAASTVAPGISSVDPSSGPRRGGTIVTLTGYGFTGANGVRFGSLTAVNFTVVSNTEIRVQTPASPTAQKVPASVSYADGASTTTSDNGPFFTYT